MAYQPSSRPYVVVGAGIHGLSTAYHLAKELRDRGLGSGRDIVVLEKSEPGAGASGIAISFVSSDEEKYLIEIEKLIKRQIPKETVEIVRTSTKTSAAKSRKPAGNEASTSHVTNRITPKKKSADPWFDKPYEPNLQKTIANSRASNSNKAPVAALLGGLKN